MANVVELVIKGLDKTKEGFIGPINSLNDLQKRISQVTPFFAGLATAAVGAFAVMGRQFINTADEAGKTAQKLGLTTESFTSLEYAAGTANVSQEAFQSGVRNLNKVISESPKLLNELGLSATDASGKLKSFDTVLIEIAEKFANAGDGAGKTAAAMKLLGKSGAEMIPFLNQGAEGVRRLTEESSNFSQTISGETAAQADEFNSNLGKIKSQLSGVVRVLVGEMLPGLVEYTRWLLEVAKQTGFVEGVTNTLIDAFKVLKFVIDAGTASFKAIWEAMKLVGDLIGNIASNFWDAFKIIGNAIGSLGAMVEQAVRGNFGVARDIFKSTIGGIETDYENFKAGLKVTGQGIVADWNKIMGQLKAGPLIPDLWQGKSVKGPKVESGDVTKPQLNIINQEDVDKASRFLADINKEFNQATKTRIQLLDLERMEKLKQLDEMGIAEEDWMAARADLNATYAAKRMEELSKIEEEEKKRHQATLEREQEKLAALLDASEIENQLRQQFHDGNIARFVELMNTEAGVRQQRLADEQAFMQAYTQIHAQAHMTIAGYASQAALTIQAGLSNALTNIVTGAQKASEAFAQLGKQLVAMVVNFIAQRLVAFALEKSLAALGLGILKSASLVSIKTAAATASAWAAAATAAAIATGGGALAAGTGVPILMGANAALGSSIALAGGLVGQAHEGFTSLPRDGSWYMQGGERIIPQQQNIDLTKFLAMQDDRQSGGSGMIVVELGGERVGEMMYKLSRNGQLTIHPRAIREA
jgi:hypothetical protein